ncbi:MAG TPA: transposase [Ktedonobacterales bacterium]|nr:transposase [Ktedonobacterales bacterium]
MLVLDYKLRVNQAQATAIDEAIRTVQFIRNKCLRYWMDQRGRSQYDLNQYSAHLAQEFPFAARLNSMARQASAERAWQAIVRFYQNCQEKKPGKKGYPRFQKDNRSVEYKTSGWRLEPDGQRLTFTDGNGIGTVRLIGTRSLETFPVQHMKRVRLVKRADGYYAQFAIQTDRHIEHVPTGKQLGIDMGLKVFSMDSEGQSVANLRFLRQAEKKLKRLHRRKDRKKKGSKNRRKAIKRLAKGYLRVSRQHKDFACKQAGALVKSSDLIAYENLQIANLVKNHHLAKSIGDAAWGQFLSWVRYYGQVHGIPVIAVPAHFTTQDCSSMLPDGTRCPERVQKSLSQRTHVCLRCGVVLDRDENAALNILRAALCTLGHRETGSRKRVKRLGKGEPLPAARQGTGKLAS